MVLPELNVSIKGLAIKSLGAVKRREIKSTVRSKINITSSTEMFK